MTRPLTQSNKQWVSSSRASLPHLLPGDSSQSPAQSFSLDLKPRRGSTRNPGSPTAAAPGRTRPGRPNNCDIHVCCTLWATAPPARLSPEGGDTCRSRATRQVKAGESRKLQEVQEEAEEDGDRPEAPVDDDLRPARSHHQVQPVALHADGAAGGFFQQFHSCARPHCRKAWREREKVGGTWSQRLQCCFTAPSFCFFHLCLRSSAPPLWWRRRS